MPEAERYFYSNLSVYPESKSFSGMLEEFFANGRLKYRGEFLEGQKREGQHIEFWENGHVKELSFWRDGWICGVAVSFHDNGTRESDIDYGEQGSRKRVWTERDYGSKTGKLLSITGWNNGQPTAIWKEEGYRKATEGEEFDSIVDDAVQRFLEATKDLEDD